MPYADENRNSSKPVNGFDHGSTLSAFEHLRAIPQWVCWNYAERKGRITKPPHHPKTGKICGATDPGKWGTYDEAKVTAERLGLAGVGFVLSPTGGLTGIDLDKCRDPKTGRIEPWAQEILNLAETYAEISPSGTGIRLFAKGRVDKAIVDSKNSKVEIYSDGGI